MGFLVSVGLCKVVILFTTHISRTPFYRGTDCCLLVFDVNVRHVEMKKLLDKQDAKKEK